MDPETIIQDLAAALDKADPPPPSGTVLGILEDQVVLSAGGADTRAFVDILDGGFQVEAHVVVEIVGDVDDEKLHQEAVEAMNEELWPVLDHRGYITQEDDWNAELGLLTRFGFGYRFFLWKSAVRSESDDDAHRITNDRPHQEAHL